MGTVDAVRWFCVVKSLKVMLLFCVIFSPWFVPFTDDVPKVFVVLEVLKMKLLFSLCIWRRREHLVHCNLEQIIYVSTHLPIIL